MSKKRRAWGWVKHTAGTGKLLSRDVRIPRPIRWGLVVAFGFGWLIPGPVDELLGVVLLAIVWFKWGAIVREHHRR